MCVPTTNRSSRISRVLQRPLRRPTTKALSRSQTLETTTTRLQPQNYQGSFAQRYAAAQPQGQVLAQSTTRYDPYQSSASTASNDWRERGRESQY